MCKASESSLDEDEDTDWQLTASEPPQQTSLRPICTNIIAFEGMQLEHFHHFTVSVMQYVQLILRHCRLST